MLYLKTFINNFERKAKELYKRNLNYEYGI